MLYNTHVKRSKRGGQMRAIPKTRTPMVITFPLLIVAAIDKNMILYKYTSEETVRTETCIHQ